MSESINPLLASIKMPGRIFQLPSRGIFYKNGELSDTVKDGEVHVHPMSAMDEIVMKNPDQLFSGQAVTAVFSRCITGIQKPTELLAKDVDALMIFLRTVTYGAGYEFMAKHTCDAAKDHSYVADIDSIIGSMVMLDPTIIEKSYTVTLPNGQVVKLRPNKYQHVLDMIKSNENKKVITAEDQQRNLVSMLLGVIESVDGISDTKLLTEWLQAIGSPFVNKIGASLDDLNKWGSNLMWTCKCRDCGESFDVEIPINPVSFFTE